MSQPRRLSQRARARRTFFAQSAAGAAALWVAGGSPAASLAQEPAVSPAKKATLSPEELRAKLLECLGGPWPEPCDLRAEVGEILQKDGYRIERLTYEAEPGERIPALLLVPDGISAQHPAPAVAVWHQHNNAYDVGKIEPAGLGGSPMHHSGVALAREGYVVLCPDTLCFGERELKKLKRGGGERFVYLHYALEGKCLAWKSILDMRRAIDYLCARPEVQADRLGCYGHSMGSTHTWLIGPWEPRLKCLVGNCCLPTYAGIERNEYVHCMYNYVPGWRKYGDIPEIAALTAPRALHFNLGEKDDGSPIQETREGLKRIAQAYAAAGVPDKFTSYIEEGSGHTLSPEMWRRASAKFAQYLKA